ncbi:hypothetical protein ACFE04_018811 [Oxalis oulophora]
MSGLFTFWLETDKVAYLLRQHFFNNLHDLLSTRPFLTLVEKKWLAFQLLVAAQQCHEKGICHGDIKCENVFVTSGNWVYLADYASFKPTYIPMMTLPTSPSSLTLEEEGSRFYKNGGEMQAAHDAPLKPSMDIFAVGYKSMFRQEKVSFFVDIFVETFNYLTVRILHFPQGQPLFELSQLLAYRRGQFDPCLHLEKIPDSGIRKMILHTIQLEPESRLSAEGYLHTYSGVVFPSYFSPFLHKFYCYWNPLNSDMRRMTENKSSGETCTGMTTNLTTMEFKQSLEMGVEQTKDLLGKKENMDKGSVQDRFKLLGDINSLLGDVKLNNHCSAEKPLTEDSSRVNKKHSYGKFFIQVKHHGNKVPNSCLATNCILLDRIGPS